MLKYLVVVTLCGVVLLNSLPAAAHSGKLGAPGSVVSGVGPASVYGVVSGSDMAYSVPAGRQMRKFVSAYIKDNDEELAEVRERSFQPFMIIDSVMGHYDLPLDLRYLAVIESELRATALSRVGAKGPWQLMAGTARELGLKVSRRSDERTNYYKSTGAAALYLRDLHREFKDWLLVLAAYNAGPGPVYRAIRLAGSRNFWALERYLPGETRQHVRRFIATAYYFAISGPVVDPVPAGPAAGQHGFPGDAGVTGGMMGPGSSEGLTGDIVRAGVLQPSGRIGITGDAWQGGSPGVWHGELPGGGHRGRNNETVFAGLAGRRPGAALGVRKNETLM